MQGKLFKFSAFTWAMLLAFLLLSTASAGEVQPSKSAVSGRKADIYWTEHGVPHIEASDWYSLGFGSAAAATSQNFCLIADQLLKIKSERSKYFGAGENNANIIADIGNKALGYIEDGKALFSEITPRAQELIRGYAAGYNDYLSKHNTPDSLPRPCKGATWVKPTTEYELFAYYLSLAERASGQALLPAAVNAAPPIAEVAKPEAKKSATKEKVSFNIAPSDLKIAAQLPTFEDYRLGSNAWSIGKDLSEHGNGILLGNPHFPAYGPLRFYQYRQRIPGVYDVQGASLVGTPCVQIGFNNQLGWSHTVSTSRHFTLYALELNSKNPLEYRYGNEFRPIIKKDITIELLLPTGEVVPYSRPTYFSHYGPMVMTPDLKWTADMAFSYRDANRRNTHFIDQWLDMGAAKNINQFKNAFRKYRGTPWVNTIYADKLGNSLYIEGTPVARLSPEALARWKANPVAQQIYQKSKIFLFMGSDPVDEWTGNKNGLTPYEEAPQLQRTDYVANSNDSHWLSNESARLVGYSPIYGPENYEQQYRTRLGLKMIKDMRGDDNKLSAKEVEDSLFSNRSYLWENIGEELKARCATWPEANLKAACESMSQWDGRFNLDSKGIPAYREFVSLWTSKMHKVPFNVDDPLNTPSGIADEPSAVDEIKAAFTKAVDNITKSAINLNATLGELQLFRLPELDKSGGGSLLATIPYPGGQHFEGAFNVQDWTNDGDLTLFHYPYLPKEEILNEKSNLTKEGYPINGGSSYMIVAEFTRNGPKARGLLSYSQSTDPDSPYYSDQNYLYSKKQLRDFPHAWSLISGGTYPKESLTIN
jgi:acyl-homoserine-lactone acylase